jgi:hypothetical protein
MAGSYRILDTGSNCCDIQLLFLPESRGINLTRSILP